MAPIRVRHQPRLADAERRRDRAARFERRQVQRMAFFDLHAAPQFDLAEAASCRRPSCSDQAIHELIEAGFPAHSLKVLCDQGIISPAERDRIIPYRTFKMRLASNQYLKADESDRMYRAVHIIAMAVAVFGDTEKAQNWLSKPKSRFSGKSPYELLSTSLGVYRVEEMLIQVAEGLYC